MRRQCSCCQYHRMDSLCHPRIHYKPAVRVREQKQKDPGRVFEIHERQSGNPIVRRTHPLRRYHRIVSGRDARETHRSGVRHWIQLYSEQIMDF